MTQNISLLVLAAATAYAADQTVTGAGNAVAEKIAAGSGLVQSAKQTLISNARQIQNAPSTGSPPHEQRRSSGGMRKELAAMVGGKKLKFSPSPTWE